MNKRISVITRGDDCGSSLSANAGILQACKDGVLRNVSLMATCAYIKEAAEMLASETDICFGLHATLNSEWTTVRWGPVLDPSRVPSLVDRDGLFFRTPEELAANRPSRIEIMMELRAQLAKLRELGFKVTYLDSHMFFERAVDGLKEEMEQWATEEGLLYHHHYYRSLPLAENGDDAATTLIRQLMAAESGQYVTIGHPAFDTDEMRMLGETEAEGEEIARGRNGERLMYADPRITEFFRSNALRAIRYDEAVMLKNS
ncbi:ChbG/HpnK family deacetylase (plasmid) [Paenibacillus rhizovicinus]|uniref:ChbG/HpnK family deacetylase n=1 Tax=Paenibacillus rhizovicinus TaxID=2704463 RepID=A0A6C0PCD6_9BACL|nr:ChbG/HpnK family deacetylase [Paenibacillus rhizovicinus]QHW35513.1 ChbG/HpnK family deacetylase [Paenibacillus rhizovicinus]